MKITKRLIRFQVSTNVNLHWSQPWLVVQQCCVLFDRGKFSETSSLKTTTTTAPTTTSFPTLVKTYVSKNAFCVQKSSSGQRRVRKGKKKVEHKTWKSIISKVRLWTDFLWNLLDVSFSCRFREKIEQQVTEPWTFKQITRAAKLTKILSPSIKKQTNSDNLRRNSKIKSIFQRNKFFFGFKMFNETRKKTSPATSHMTRRESRKVSTELRKKPAFQSIFHSFPSPYTKRILASLPPSNLWLHNHRTWERKKSSSKCGSRFYRLLSSWTTFGLLICGKVHDFEESRC